MADYKTPPTKCEIPGCEYEFRPIEGATFYDANLLGGPWGNVCEIHFRLHGKGLGVGLGQKYCYNTKWNKWYLSKG